MRVPDESICREEIAARSCWPTSVRKWPRPVVTSSRALIKSPVEAKRKAVTAAVAMRFCFKTLAAEKIAEPR